MANFILFLNRLINLYLYFIVGACVLSWVPNINPNYPLFHYIFNLAGFYILPPFMGMNFSLAFVMVVCAIIIAGLEKIYSKYYAEKEPKIIVVSPEEFLAKLTQQKEEVKKNDSDNDNKSDS